MKLKNNNNKISSIVIEDTQYEVVDGVASFKDEHIHQAKNCGFKYFLGSEVEVVEEVKLPEVEEAPKKKNVRKKDDN